ncbi:MAG TPA: hypothetical protein VE775_07960, partial [Pyrinomonadaceae bacterium]|nr:hypothetical protein [Pyrinomonadaceae bacterium]
MARRLLDSRKAHSLATREGIPALVVHTKSLQLSNNDKKSGLYSFSGKPARSFNSPDLLGISGAGAAPALLQMQLTLVGNLSDGRLAEFL